jgi:cell division protein FtsB
MTEGVERLSAEFIQQTVASAVAGEINRSALIPQILQTGILDRFQGEVDRLQQVVAQQAAQIGDLQARLDRARAEVHRLEARQLVTAVADALLRSTSSLSGYVIDEAQVQVKAALEFDNGRITMTADPGGLLDSNSLSTFDVHLRALPPALGEPSLLDALDAVRAAGEQLLAALDEPGLEPGARAATLRALSDLLADLQQAARWQAFATALEAVAAADARVAVSGQAARAAALEVVAAVGARSLAAAARSVRALAADLGQLRG